MFKKYLTADYFQKMTALDRLQSHVMIADSSLNIVYMNKSLTLLMQEAEPELKKELPRFGVATLIGSNIDVFHKNPAHQRTMLASLEKPHYATIRVGTRVFDVVVTPLMRGIKRTGFVVEWADAKARLLNLDHAAQALAIGSTQAIIEFTVDGNIILANKAFQQTMGYSMDEIIGKHHSMFVENSFRDSKEYKDFWKQLSVGHAISSEFKRIAKNGKVIWLHGSYNPIVDASGKVTKVIKLAIDITDRMRSVSDIADALKGLAEGNLEQRIEHALTPELDKLRIDLNSAFDTLQDTMQNVDQSARAIKSGTEEIRISSDDLSRRTEQQAASLEETAAALDEITATVKQTSDNAVQARKVVGDARKEAESSATVVRRAVDAMRGIENSSGQISQIISVIDEIAFQTNLLALNAGVEAARAGEAGRGFAVVASEVRALAQRSAEAAKEIKSLISSSTAQVDDGVRLVVQTGTVLEKIIAQVGEINTVVSTIAASALEQATALQEVNTAVNQMDQVTQQNAAMVEEATAAAHALAEETSTLTAMVEQFRLGGPTAPSTPRQATATSQARSKSERAIQAKGGPKPVVALKTIGGQGAARKTQAAPDAADWKDF